MQTHISSRGFELTDELRGRTEALAREVAGMEPGLRMAKFVLEERAPNRAIGVVLALGDGTTVVRHGQGGDWDRAFLELQRRLEKAFPDETS